MAVPKCKVSKSRRDSRAANWKIDKVGLVECPNCHEYIQSHRVCPHCGFYDKEQVVNFKAKKDN